MLTVQHEAGQVHERPREKSCTKPRKLYEGSGKSRADSAARIRESYMKDPEKSHADIILQHEAAIFTRKTWRRVAKIKLAWLYPTKVRKQLQS